MTLVHWKYFVNSLQLKFSICVKEKTQKTKQKNNKSLVHWETLFD